MDLDQGINSQQMNQRNTPNGMSQARILLAFGLCVWALAVGIGVESSLRSGWSSENFTLLFMILAAFCPDMVSAEASVNAVFVGVSITSVVVFSLLAIGGWRKHCMGLAIAFTGGTLLSIVVWLVRMFVHLLSIH